MVMNFDNYSTSFQSLMSPMYNVQANYSAMAGGYGNGYGAGLGMGGYYPGMGAGYMGMGMGGFMTPMNGVGIGQFNADYLIKNDDKNNNYYARPIAAHKKHDEAPTMLGILGTALGTTALLLALAKGKKFRWPGKGAKPKAAGTTPVNPTPVNATPVNPAPVNPQTKGYLPAPGQVHTNPNTAGTTPVNPSPVNPKPANPASVNQTPVNPQTKGYLPAPGQVHTSPNTAGTTPANPTPVNPNAPQIKGYLPAPGQQNLPVPVQHNKVELGPIENYLPKQQQTFNLPQHGIKGYLPAPGQQNLPVPVQHNKVELGPIENYLPKQQQTFNLPQQGIKGYLPAPNNAETANKKLAEIRPDMATQGNVVFTTHTPETFNTGYSIGANAKGADKLQALLAQLS